MVNRRTYVLASVILLVVVCAFYFMRSNPSSQENEEPPASPGVQIGESRLVGRLDGKRQWEIDSEQVHHSGNVVTITDINEAIIFRDDAPYFYIKAERGVWYRSTNVLELEGDLIEVTGPDDFQLDSERLVWRGHDETLESPGPVVIHYEGADIRADHMLVETKESLVILKQNVRIQEGKHTWALEHAVYALDKEVLGFYGDAVLNMEGGWGDE
ncbi:MAG: LPS export ABC transporter periplasmic protein LptC [Firmicutes bacterium]|nr:LPS export ABC transporter periplasmic protein LptC [Bacillota bacterium]